ncbi:MAG: tail fiber domain-containing protein [Spirosomaceae bacterium]|nr:tail fiber domain-containing protein [Spirosomataceae bacterium]
MKKLIFLFVLAMPLGVFAQSIVLTPDKMESKQSSNSDQIVLQGVTQPNILGRRQNGTLTVPTAVVNGNYLLNFQGAGHNGSSFTSPRATIRLQASQNWTTTNNGTQIQFATTENGSTTLTERMIISNEGRVGIGTDAPQRDLDVAGNGGIQVRTYGAGNTFNSFIVGSHANGTESAPTASTNDQILARFEGRGHNGAYFDGNTRMEVRASQNWASGAYGSELLFYTTPNNSDIALRRMKIAPNGNVGINNDSPNHYLEVLPENDNGFAVKAFSVTPTIFGVHAGGNVNAPGPSLNDAILARFGAKGYDGTGFTNAKARIEMRAANTWSATNTGAAIDFWTTAATGTTPQVSMTLSAPGNLGIGRLPTAGFRLEVEGDAAKNTAGNWSSHSDRRLKKNITYLNSHDALAKVMQLKGVTYEWNDTQTGSKRPEGIQYGFVAQEIKEVFPTKVRTDDKGFLMTAYGDYDPMLVESIKALKQLIDAQNELISSQTARLDAQQAEINALKASANTDTPSTNK